MSPPREVDNFGCSWADELKDFVHSRTAVPYETQPEVFLHTRGKSAMWRSRERRYDPITQQLRDEKEEGHRMEREKEVVRERVKSAAERRLQTETPYNIINFLSFRDGSKLQDPPRRTRYALTPGADYDIVSNLEHSKTFLAPEELRPLEKSRVGDRRKRGKMQFAKSKMRDVDIISNEYITDDAKKKQRDEEIRRKETHDRYYKTHDFDVIKQKYIVPDKDMAVFQEEEELGRRTREYAKQRVAPSIRESEGYAYDIANFAQRSKESLEILEQQKNKRVITIQRNREEALIRKEEREREYERQAQRALERISNRKLLDASGACHNYNIMNNVPFQGVDGRYHPVLSSLRPKRTAWDRCTVNLPPKAPIQQSRGASSAVASEISQPVRSTMSVTSAMESFDSGKRPRSIVSGAEMDNEAPNPLFVGETSPVLSVAEKKETRGPLTPPLKLPSRNGSEHEKKVLEFSSASSIHSSLSSVPRVRTGGFSSKHSNASKNL